MDIKNIAVKDLIPYEKNTNVKYTGNEKEIIDFLKDNIELDGYKTASYTQYACSICGVLQIDVHKEY